MSLIEEALRKQREESEKTGNVSVTPAPIPNPPPEPTPEAAAPLTEEPARRSWALLAGIAAAGVSAILFIIWLLVFGLKLWHTQTDTKTTKAGIPTNAPAAVMVNPASTHTNVPEKSPVPAPPPVVQAPTSAPPVSLPPPVVPPATQETHPASKSTTPVTDNLPQKTSLTTTPNTAKLEMPVMWPKLTVSGIIGSSKSGRSAVIMNGQMLSPGETIEGVTIESIDKQKVRLKYSGEVKLLSVGASTE